MEPIIEPDGLEHSESFQRCDHPERSAANRNRDIELFAAHKRASVLSIGRVAQELGERPSKAAPGSQSAMAPIRECRQLFRSEGFILFVAALLERSAFDDGSDELREAVVLFGEVFRNLVAGAAVVIFEAATQRIGEHFFRQATNEVTAFLFEEDVAQFARAFKGFAGDQFAGRIDRRAAIFIPPCADAVEVFEAEANRVHALMTNGAIGFGAYVY